MATVTGLTAARMLAIEAASIVDGEVVGDDLILTKHNGTTINAGNVRGATGPAGTTDHGLLTGLSDDDHPQYQKVSQKAAASGYASLDASTKVPIAQVPTGTSGTTVALGDHAHIGTYWGRWTGTQAQYDALGTYDTNVLYVVV